MLSTATVAVEDLSKKSEIEEIAHIYSASMQYIFKQQTLINSQIQQKPNLFGQLFINNVKSTYLKKYNNKHFPGEHNLATKTLLEVMIEVMEDNKTLLLDQDITFKGFIPAIFAFQISERYSQKGIGIKIKFTNELSRVRNKFNIPDLWEMDAIKQLQQHKLTEIYDEKASFRGVASLRYITPVPMSNMCLTCHGSPKDNPANVNKAKREWTNYDKTGFKMESWKITDFGGAISVTVYDVGALGETY